MDNIFFIISRYRTNIFIGLLIGFILLLYYKNNNKIFGGIVNKVIDLRCHPYIKKKYVSPWLNSFMEYDYRSKCLK
jgi:hypothetical protein